MTHWLYRKESKYLGDNFPTIDDYGIFIDQEFNEDLYNAHIARLTPFYQRRNIINQEKQQILLKAQNDAIYELKEEVDKLEDRKKWYLHEIDHKSDPEYLNYSSVERRDEVLKYCKEQLAKINSKIIELKEIITNEEIRIAKKEQIRK